MKKKEKKEHSGRIRNTIFSNNLTKEKEELIFNQ